MIETKQRVRIIGPPGSHIVDLAVALSEQSGLRFVNLPDIEKQPRPYTVLEKALHGEKWIVCGSIVHEWAETTIDDANMLFFINTDRRICFIRLCFRLLRRFYDFHAWKRFWLDFKVLRKYKKLLENWKQKHRNVEKKILYFETIDQAYAHYIKKSAPDLFM